jgi:fibronectin type 3 domain-containing protein
MRRLLPLVLLFAIALVASPSSPAGAIDVSTAPTLTSTTGMNGYVVLNWNVPAFDGGSKIQSYKIYRGTSPGSETFLTSVGAQTTMNDGMSVVNETTYYYRISAVNGLGEGPLSNELSARPSASVTRPGAPVLNSVSSASGSGPVTLSWSAPSSGGLTVSSYRIYRATSTGASTQPVYATVKGSATTFSDANVVSGGTYYYAVTAMNDLGAGPASSELSARVGSGPAPQSGVPTAPTVTSAFGMNGYVNLSWTAPAWDGLSNVKTYKIYRGTSAGNETFLTAYQSSTTTVNEGLSMVNDTTHY